MIVASSIFVWRIKANNAPDWSRISVTARRASAPGGTFCARSPSPAGARRRQASAKKNASCDQVIAKYDANADGELDFGECKKLLADMLGGAQPADEEARDSPPGAR